MRTTQPPIKSGTIESRPAHEGSPNERRRKSTRAFILRVVLLTFLIASVAYGAWFAPWARPVNAINVESVRPPRSEAPEPDARKVETMKPETEKPVDNGN
jgi:hypothetical protein